MGHHTLTFEQSQARLQRLMDLVAGQRSAYDPSVGEDEDSKTEERKPANVGEPFSGVEPYKPSAEEQQEAAEELNGCSFETREVPKADPTEPIEPELFGYHSAVENCGDLDVIYQALVESIALQKPQQVELEGLDIDPRMLRTLPKFHAGGGRTWQFTHPRTEVFYHSQGTEDSAYALALTFGSIIIWVYKGDVRLGYIQDGHVFLRRKQS
jgi:hypothetical protein